MAAADPTATPAPAKKSGLIATIGVIAVLTLIAGGGGWVVGGILAPKSMALQGAEAKAPAATAAPAADAHAAPAGKDGGEGAKSAQPGTLLLEPITTNLSYPSDNWIRIEVMLEFGQAPDEALAAQIHQDIMAYLRTVSLQQIEGPRGFQYLRDDLRERVLLRSEGRVKDIIFRTFVIE